MAISPDEHDQLVAQLDEAKAQLLVQEAQLGELRQQLATAIDAIARLSEQKDRNSTNSNLPPSSDGPGAASRGVR
ncbi:MAG: hypothetical protein JKY37_00630, partial [Nannocystaceae bacterium]|nr:hypothetical protein [Nannocystaceae bacterium]